MTSARFGFVVLLTLLLNACAVFEPRPTEAEIATQQAAAATAERLRVNRELEAQRLEQERLLAEERAREAEVARAEAARQQAEAARQQAETTRQPEQQQTQSVEERARIVARQQERIAELRAQVAANQTETTNVESANATLLQAITAAEALVQTLTDEQGKYGTTDPATGATVEALSKERIAELNAELERLQNQAAALSQQP